MAEGGRGVALIGLLALAGCTSSSSTEAPGVPRDDEAAEARAQDPGASEIGPESESESESEPEPEPQPRPEPARATLELPPGEPIIEVGQRMIPAYGWGFSPKADRVSAELEDGCGIWAVESGLYLGEWSEAGSDPCREWPMGETLIPYESELGSADRELRAELDGAAVVIHKGEAKLRSLSCRSCAGVEDLAWAPRGHELVLARADGRVERWDADRGKRLKLLSRAPKLRARDRLASTRVGWSSLGVAVAHNISWRDEDGKPFDPADWRSQLAIYEPGGKRLHRLDSEDRSALESAFVDPKRRFVFARHDVPDSRAEYDTSRLVTHALGKAKTQLWWDEYDREYRMDDQLTDYGALDRVAEGSWRAGASTQWLGRYFGQKVSWDLDSAFGWLALRADPPAALDFGEVVDSDDLDAERVELELLGHDGRRALVNWSYVLEAGGEDEPERFEHRAKLDLPKGCELVELGPALDDQLLRCEAGLRLRRGQHSLELGLADGDRWRWGRGGWLAVELDGRLVIVDGTKIVGRREGATILDAPLSARADRLVIAVDGGLELLRMADGGLELRVDVDPRAAALAPAGDRLAVADRDDTLRIFAVPEGTLLARWQDQADKLAFAQDGRLLFIGYDRPLRARNSYTGEAVAHEFPDVADGSLDPSWRWLMSSRGELTRLLDGRSLRIGAGWALLDDGRFFGSPPGYLLDHRQLKVGEALAEPDCRVGDLEPWLRDPKLLEDFFAGRPLAPAAVPTKDLDKLGCGRP